MQLSMTLVFYKSCRKGTQAMTKMKKNSSFSSNIKSVVCYLSILLTKKIMCVFLLVMNESQMMYSRPPEKGHGKPNRREGSNHIDS